MSLSLVTTSPLRENLASMGKQVETLTRLVGEIPPNARKRSGDYEPLREKVEALAKLSTATLEKGSSLADHVKPLLELHKAFQGFLNTLDKHFSQAIKLTGIAGADQNRTIEPGRTIAHHEDGKASISADLVRIASNLDELIKVAIPDEGKKPEKLTANSISGLKPTRPNEAAAVEAALTAHSSFAPGDTDNSLTMVYPNGDKKKGISASDFINESLARTQKAA